MLGAAGRAAPGHRPHLPGGADLGWRLWFYVAGILRQAVLAPEIDSSVLIGFPPPQIPRLRRAPVGDLPPRRRPARDRRGGLGSRRPRQPRSPRPGQRKPAVARPGRSGRSQGRLEQPAAGTRSNLASRRGGRGSQHHADRACWNDEARSGSACARGHQGSHPHAVPLGGHRLGRPGGRSGRGRGALSTALYASVKGWSVVVPALAWGGGFGIAVLIGATAGLLPALRAARLSPTEALWAI